MAVDVDATIGSVARQHSQMPCRASRAQEARFLAPPNGNFAPQQHYMLFLLRRKVYSRAVWVTLQA